jgi:hypothetical protein
MTLLFNANGPVLFTFGRNILITVTAIVNQLTYDKVATYDHAPYMCANKHLNAR